MARLCKRCGGVIDIHRRAHAVFCSATCRSMYYYETIVKPRDSIGKLEKPKERPIESVSDDKTVIGYETAIQ